MDYAEMVSQIMAAEQGAKVLAEESLSLIHISEPTRPY